LPRRALHLLIGECRARGHAARQQIRIADAAGARAIQFGDQGAARIRGNTRDRSGTRTEAEPVQGDRSFRFGIKGHASSSLRADPMSPRVSKVLRGRSANVPVAACRNHDQEMKNWKGAVAVVDAFAPRMNAQPAVAVHHSGPRKTKNAPSAISANPTA
jgi:hypothetical protein